MQAITFRSLFCILFFGMFFSISAWSQIVNSRYFDVEPIQNSGVRFWSSATSPNNNYKIHMGNGSQHKYGPVTDYAIKMNMNNAINRGWTWGVYSQTPVMAVNTQGKLQTESWIKSMEGTFYFGDFQSLSGNNSDNLSIKSNHSSLVGLRFNDKENVNYGSISGTNDGLLFGLKDADNNWSLLSRKDDWTAFLVNNQEKMRINSDGKIGIGSNIDYSPTGYRLYVQGGVIAEKVKVALESTDDWADYVFEDNYDLLSIQAVDQFIKTHNHLPKVPSAKELLNTGIDLAKMDAKLLEKIEELTLYMIQMNKQLDDLKVENAELKKIIIENK